MVRRFTYLCGAENIQLTINDATMLRGLAPASISMSNAWCKISYLLVGTFSLVYHLSRRKYKEGFSVDTFSLTLSKCYDIHIMQTS